jgi:hypothetical protein
MLHHRHAFDDHGVGDAASRRSCCRILDIIERSVSSSELRRFGMLGGEPVGEDVVAFGFWRIGYSIVASQFLLPEEQSSLVLLSFPTIRSCMNRTDFFFVLICKTHN